MEDFEDMVSMDDLSEKSMVENAFNRYKRDCISLILLSFSLKCFAGYCKYLMVVNIYTWIGDVLVAVNPWKDIKAPPYVC